MSERKQEYQLKIYGRSDDLIEIEGDIYDEIGWHPDEKCYITISDGTVISIEYADEGIWRIVMLCEGSGDPEIIYAPPDDDDNYSDALILPLGHYTWVKWIIHSGEVIKPPRTKGEQT